jgi:hypothetical protein
VTAALAESEAGREPASRPGPQLRERILAAAAADQAVVHHLPRRHRPRRLRMVLASAAAAAVLIGGAAVTGRLADHSSTAPPLAVGSFGVSSQQRTPVRIGALAVPYQGTWAFAVSLEHGRAIPASPSRPVALGQISS